jgi:hypothetical protein
MHFDDGEGDIGGQARERYALLVPLSLARARLDAERRVDGHRACSFVRARVFETFFSAGPYKTPRTG